jgi:diguanylate cyclase (GGDEF)-like protein
MVTPFDPWDFLLRLNGILTKDSSQIELMQGLLDAIQDIHEITASWIAAAGPDGAMVPLLWRGEFVPLEPLSAPRAPRMPPRVPPCMRAACDGEIIYIDDWRAEPDSTSHIAWAANWRSGIAIPLTARAKGQQAGQPPAGARVLVMQSSQPGFFSRVWPPAIAAHLASIVATALQARQAAQALLHAETLYKALFNGADMLLTAESETNVMDKLCAMLVESGLFVSATIGQMAADQTWRHRSTAARTHAELLRRAGSRHRGDDRDLPLNMLAWQAGKTLIANRYNTDPRFTFIQDVATKVGIAAVASMIIRRGKQRWAVLSVTADQEDFFNQDIIRLLERLADMVSHTLDEFDLKAQLEAEREIQRRLAREDDLTALPNRLALIEQLTDSLARAARTTEIVIVIKFDLDDFRAVNERFGRTSGDAVIKAIAGRLRDVLPETDFCARMGDDEFAVILENRPGTQELPGFLRHLQEHLAEPIILPAGAVVQVTFCAGVTAYPRDNGDADLLLRHADMALYAAKGAKGSGEFWRKYRDIADGEQAPRFGRALLEAGALRVHYQPVLELFSGRITSVEALARMEENGQLLPPAKFLHDLLLDDRLVLFEQVLQTALQQSRAWDEAGLSFAVSVNIDAQILLLDGTMTLLRDALAQSGLPPARLCLELLETHDFIDLRKARRQIEAVRALGIRLALDDLGAGYSSILKIRELPLDVVKLDRSFVKGLRQQPDDMMFVTVFQNLTADREMALVVEGVETENVLDALNMMGVRYIQGFLIARPMPAEALTDWLLAWSPRPAAGGPKTILGAYAVHLSWLRAFNNTRSREEALHELRRSDGFSLDHFFREQELAGTKLHDAYETFRTLLRMESIDRGMIVDAAAQFRTKLMAALKAGG